MGIKFLKKSKPEAERVEDDAKVRTTVEETLKDIAYAAKSLNKIKKIRCIGLTGNSKFFSPGADIKELKNLNSKQAKKNKLFAENS